MLKVSGLVKTFNPGKPTEKKAIRGVDFTLNDGDFVSVIGGNGAGKSTLLNIIAGSIFPDAGHVEIDGKDITYLPEHRRARYLGRVFQDPLMGTCPDMLIAENLALALRRGKKHGLKWGLGKQERKAYEEGLARFGLGLEKRLDAKVSLLSGGQRQALTLYMATLVTPKILLLDEHTAALDPKTAKIVMDITEQLVSESHIPTFMVTHNMKDAIRYGNRLIMMNEGKIIFEASGEEKSQLTVEELVRKFSDSSDLPDAMILG